MAVRRSRCAVLANSLAEANPRAASATATRSTAARGRRPAKAANLARSPQAVTRRHARHARVARLVVSATVAQKSHVAQQVGTLQAAGLAALSARTIRSTADRVLHRARRASPVLSLQAVTGTNAQRAPYVQLVDVATVAPQKRWQQKRWQQTRWQQKRRQQKSQLLGDVQSNVKRVGGKEFASLARTSRLC